MRRRTSTKQPDTDGVLEISDSSDDDASRRVPTAHRRATQKPSKEGRKEQHQPKADKGKGRARSKGNGPELGRRREPEIDGRTERLQPEEWAKKWGPKVEELRAATEAAISLFAEIHASAGVSGEEDTDLRSVRGVTEDFANTNLGGDISRTANSEPPVGLNVGGGSDSKARDSGKRRLRTSAQLQLTANAGPTEPEKNQVASSSSVPTHYTDEDAMVVDEPEPQLDLDAAVATVLQIVPGLDPVYIVDLIRHHTIDHGSHAVEAVLQQIFEETQTEYRDTQDGGEGRDVLEYLRGVDATLTDIGEVGGARGHSDPIPKESLDNPSVECGVCYERLSTKRTIQCPKQHSFCSACLERYATLQLGESKSRLTCMQDCDAFFHPADLRRMLPDNLLTLFERLAQRQELKEAGLENFEECPFCNWGCVMDVTLAESSVFRCYNVGICEKISCRLCRQEQHFPRPCEEADKDKRERHALEEALSRAVIRKCPNCPQGV